MGRRTLVIGALLLSLCCRVALVRAASTDDTIPAGTKITQENWQKYQQFMGEGTKLLFKGSSYWKMPKDFVMLVGPTVSIPLPKKYLEDTEKFSSQVSLQKLPTGGYVPANYTAGIPFPNPLKGDQALTGQRIFWNSFYRYIPRVVFGPNVFYVQDRFNNLTETAIITAVTSQLAHISDPGYPTFDPGNSGYFQASYTEQKSPEQGKYTTSLDLEPLDPTRVDELYAYIPSLRRSLRLSTASRCAPIFGSDYLNDDVHLGAPGLPQLFQVKYLGERKILEIVHGASDSFTSFGTPRHLDERYFYSPGIDMVPMPSPGSGVWELRDSYVLSVERLPQFAKGYCYGSRLIYVDKENYWAGAEIELYDAAGRLYKTIYTFLTPEPIPDTNGDVAENTAGPANGVVVNFQDEHATLALGLRGCTNRNCANGGYSDARRYANPAGLMQIMR